MLSKPEHLYVDSLENPDKYDPRILPVLRELVANRRPPTQEERKLLDAAVLDFNSAPKQKTTERSRPIPKPKPESYTGTEDKAPSAESGMTVPEGAPKPFWWL